MSTEVSGMQDRQGDEPGCLCVAGEIDADRFSDLISERVLAEIPTFTRFPLAEQQESRRELIGIILAALAAGVGPTPEQIRLVRSIARRRMFFGLPVADVLATLHIFSVELWKALGEEETGFADTEEIGGLLGVHWAWVQAMSSAVADAYAEEVSMRKGRELSLRHRLLEALRGGGATLEDAHETARNLGFDPSGDFQAFCVPAAALAQEKASHLQSRLSQLSGVIHCGQRDQTIVALAQAADPRAVGDEIRRCSDDALVFGVGLARPGLRGAELSISDASRVLALVPPGVAGALRFEDHWLDVSLLGAQDRIDPLLTVGRRAAEEHPHIADAVRAFAFSGFSISAAAESLIVHPNTAAYRLRRWQELTGWDPRSLHGFLLSVVALGISPAAPRSLAQ